jgi:hypothetical protein
MYGFGTFGTGTAYTVLAPPKKMPKKKKMPPSTANELPPSPESLNPAIERPPSPERIRAYTEQMKRSSIFGNNSRSNTISSVTSSFRSRGSGLGSTDNLSLSRKSSGRSTVSTLPSSRGDRPESVQMFGRGLFSRRGKRSKEGSNSVDEGLREEGLARDHYYGQDKRPRRGTVTGSTSPPQPEDQRTRHLISGPYNFQHVTHTRQNHLPDLERSSQMELASGFSAVRASQLPTRGELKGIRTQDLHFENFSSEALSAPSPDVNIVPPHHKHQRQRGVLRKSVGPHLPQRPSLTSTKSHDNFKSPPPPRPPRSPMSPTCPMELPTRTSSRTASVLFETFDPLAAATLERPQTNGGFKRPAPLGVLSPPPPAPRWSEQDQEFSSRRMSHAMTTPSDEAWPLTTTTSGNFGGELADVQEEEEEAAKRRSRFSTTSGELRMSQSVPALRLRSYNQSERLETPAATTMLHQTSSPRPPLSPGFQLSQDSWDNAIDYAYEHEAEADCDYQWDRNSMDDDNATVGGSPSNHVEAPTLDLHLEDDDRSVYHGRFRPSLIVPSTFDIPELSPMSNASTSSIDPRTPSNFLKPHHMRPPSQASSFKESHGFTLSPSLLIPTDFRSQMDQEALYDEHFHGQTTSASIFAQEPYAHSISPVDETTSSTASYRSSNYSRVSARSSSSTRMSGTNSRGSQDSMILLSRAAGISQAHRSIGSASSLPDLIPSTMRKPEATLDADLSQSVGALNLEETGQESVSGLESSGSASGMSSLPHRRNKSLAKEPGARKGINHFAPPQALFKETEPANLSPVAESFQDPAANGPAHGRKVSAPVMGQTVREFKGRARSNTTGAGKKSRGSYMLFPQI